MPHTYLLSNLRLSESLSGARDGDAGYSSTQAGQPRPQPLHLVLNLRVGCSAGEVGHRGLHLDVLQVHPALRRPFWDVLTDLGGCELLQQTAGNKTLVVQITVGLFRQDSPLQVTKIVIYDTVRRDIFHHDGVSLCPLLGQHKVLHPGAVVAPRQGEGGAGGC